MFTVNSGEEISKAIALHDKAQYADALAAYDKIPRNDTNYVKACFEAALSARIDKQFPRAIAYAKRGLEVPYNDMEHDLLLQIGNIYDEWERYDSAMYWFGKAKERFPNSFVVEHSRGISFYLQKKYDSSFACFRRVLLKNPFAFNTHYFMGNLASELGYPVQAMMSYAFCMAVNPGSSRQGQALAAMYRLTNLSDDVLSKMENRKTYSFLSENYSDLENFFKAKMAMEEKYKIKTPIDEITFRQLNLVAEYLPETNTPEAFYGRFYGTLFRSMYKENLFGAFTVQMVSEVENEKAQQLTKKYDSDVKKLRDFLRGKLNDIGYAGNLEGKADYGFLFENGRPAAYGKRNDKNPDELDGLWIFFNEVGDTLARAMYKKGEPEGEFITWYNNHKVKSKGTIRGGQKQGLWLSYYSNGSLKEEENYTAGKLNGAYKSFHRNGATAETHQYVNAKKNGPAMVHFESGSPRYDLKFQNDLPADKLTEYYPYGKLKSVTGVRNGKAEGEFTNYHGNGQIEMKGKMHEGDKDGLCMSYYYDGTLYSKENYKEGKLHGACEYFHRNGVRSEVSMFDNGERSGMDTVYDEEKRILTVTEYKRDHIKSIAYYNVLTGKVVYSSKVDDKDKNLIKLYSRVGTLSVECITDRDGQYNGEYKSYYDDGSLDETRMYVNGEGNGPLKSYFKNGKLAEEYTLLNDEKEGQYRSWYYNGQLRSEGMYTAGQRQGYWYEYNSAGTLMEKEYFIDDERHGPQEYFHPNGVKRVTDHYEHGVSEMMIQYDSSGKETFRITFEPGKAHTYTFKGPTGKDMRLATTTNGYLQGAYEYKFPDGSVKTKGYYRNGLKDSLLQSYYPGGQLERSGHYLNNERHGRWVSYYRDGKIKQIEHFAFGDAENSDTLYYENGAIEIIIPYKDDKRHGMLARYAPGGELIYKYHYLDGILVGYTYENPDGSLHEEIPVENNGKTVTLKSFYRNGKVSHETGYKNRDYEDGRKVYYPDGKVLYECTYKLGKRMSPEKEYYANGQLKTQLDFKEEEVDGKHQEFTPDGKLYTELVYKNGYLHGPANYYDQQGKLQYALSFWWDDPITMSKH